MKTSLFCVFFSSVIIYGNPFPFITRRWDFGDCRDNIDTLTTDNGNLFLARNNKMQWLRPLTDKPIVHLSRDFPRSINRLSINKKALLANLSPEDHSSVSETIVFFEGKCFRSCWKDNTMYETIIGQNGYLLRSNYFGNITYGNHNGLYIYNTRTLTNFTYTAMVVHDKYLWCAVEYKNKNGTRVTRIDAFDLHVPINGVDHLASVPDMSFLVENKGCAYPCQLWVSIENFSPKKLVYIIIGYMMGGVNVAQSYYPTEKQYTQTMCSNLPNEHAIQSISFDRPYLFFLDEEGISSYKLFPRMDLHQYFGKYKLPKNYYSRATQIVSLKRQVFWNGGQNLYSVEVVEK